MPHALSKEMIKLIYLRFDTLEEVQVNNNVSKIGRPNFIIR